MHRPTCRRRLPVGRRTVTAEESNAEAVGPVSPSDVVASPVAVAGTTGIAPFWASTSSAACFVYDGEVTKSVGGGQREVPGWELAVPVRGPVRR